MTRISRRPWTRPLQVERYTRAKENTMEFSNQMETLEKKAGETAAAVKAAAAASRLHSMTIDADRPIVFHHSLVWLLDTAQVTALR
jgi:hypothetical protein